MVGCVQSLVDKNNFLVLFEDGQKKEIGSCSPVYLPTTTPKSTMSSPVVTKKEGMKMTKQTKTTIVVGSDVKAKFGVLE